MDNIRLQNFRVLSDTGEIQLKPLTVLVGSNSSGKSSFLRFFPLLKQSYAASKIGPVLWYKENGVDFGDFKTTLKKGEEYMTIGFTMKQHLFSGRKNPSNSDISIRVTIAEDNQNPVYDYVKKLIVIFGDVRITVEYSSGNASVLINDYKCSSFHYYARSSTSFIPLVFKEQENRIDGFDSIFEHIRKSKKYFRGIEDFMFMSFREFSELASGFDSKLIEHLFYSIMEANLSDMLRLIDMNIQLDISELSYLGPFREEPHRFYRLQNLSTTNLDISGSNMAMFLNGMDDDEFSALNLKIKTQYKFEIIRKRNEGFMSLYIKDGNKETNIIDNGFGYSQIMPVLLSLFAFKQDNKRPRFRRGDGKLLCIEQPELHLHPSMQYNFGLNLFDSIAHTQTPNNKIIIETHSRSIIDAIGTSISKQPEVANSIVVYLFDYDTTKQCSSVRRVNFNEEGYLIDWPLGFLD